MFIFRPSFYLLSFAGKLCQPISTHLLKNETDIGHIQLLLGHNATKTTEIYTHVANRSFIDIKDLLS
ncbi:MAG: tyrosine-type recombinase/integrase [Saonia sp.]